MNTPEDRLEEDESSSQSLSRETNLLRIAEEMGIKSQTYHLVPFDCPISSPMDVRTKPMVGRIEMVLIDCLRFFGSNSAAGGVRSEVWFPPEVTAVGQRCLDASKALGIDPDACVRDPEMGRLIFADYADEREFWRSAMADRKQITDDGFKGAVEAAGGDIIRERRD